MPSGSHFCYCLHPIYSSSTEALIYHPSSNGASNIGSGRFVPWPDIPKELAERIGNCLDTNIDVLHFCAVCITWRSSLAPFRTIPPFPLEIPFPLIDHELYKAMPGYHLIESTIYIFQPLDSDSIDSPCKGWLIKVIQTTDGKLKVLNPLIGRLIQVLPDHMPKYCRGNCIYYVHGAVFYDDEDSEMTTVCVVVVALMVMTIVILLLVVMMILSNPIRNYDPKTNDFGSHSGGGSISNDDHKINASSSKSGGVREKQAVDRYKGVFDENTCVFTLEDGKLGSLLSSLDYAEILWPPPS